MTTTYAITRKQWIKLEMYISLINDILETAQEFDTSTLPTGESLNALTFRGQAYVVNPEEKL